MNQQGFTLVESLLALALLGVLIAGITSLDSNTLGRNVAKQTKNTITDAFFLARQNTVANKEGDEWGVDVAPQSLTVFLGDDFVGRDTSYDEVFTLDSGVSITAGTATFYLSSATGLVQNPPVPHNIETTYANGQLFNLTVDLYGNVQ